MRFYKTLYIMTLKQCQTKASCRTKKKCVKRVLKKSEMNSLNQISSNTNTAKIILRHRNSTLIQYKHHKLQSKRNNSTTINIFHNLLINSTNSSLLNNKTPHRHKNKPIRVQIGLIF